MTTLRTAIIAIALSAFLAALSLYANLSTGGNQGTTLQTSTTTSSLSTSHTTTTTSTQHSSSSESSSSSSSSSTSSSSSSSSSTASSSSTTTSSSSTTTTASTESGNTSSLGGATLVSFDASAPGSAYDSVNGLVYAWDYNQMLVIKAGTVIATIPSNDTLLNGNSWVAYNSFNGTVYSLVPYKIQHNGCAIASLTVYSGETRVGLYQDFFPGLSGPVVYNSREQYLAFATFGNAGLCQAGLQIFEDNSSQYFVPVGPQQSPGSSQVVDTIPALAYDSPEDIIYVPLVNQTAANANSTFYLVSGYSVLPTNFTLPGQTSNLLFDGQNRYLYAEQSLDNGSVAIYAVDTRTNSIVATIPLSGNSSLADDSGNRLVYAFGYSSVLAISGRSVQNTYSEPTGNATVYSAVYDSVDGELVNFVSSGGSGSLPMIVSPSIVTGTTIAGGAAFFLGFVRLGGRAKRKGYSNLK